MGYGLTGSQLLNFRDELLHENRVVNLPPEWHALMDEALGPVQRMVDLMEASTNPSASAPEHA